MEVSTCLLTLLCAFALTMVTASIYSALKETKPQPFNKGLSLKGVGLAGLALFLMTLSLYVKKEVQIGAVQVQVTSCNKKTDQVVQVCPVDSFLKISKL